MRRVAPALLIRQLRNYTACCGTKRHDRVHYNGDLVARTLPLNQKKSRMRKAAQLMVFNLAGSLALAVVRNRSVLVLLNISVHYSSSSPAPFQAVTSTSNTQYKRVQLRKSRPGLYAHREGGN